MRRPTYLFVVPSSSQMYSGTGKAIFDWIRYSIDVFDFSILVDTMDLSNTAIIQSFGLKMNLEVILSQPMLLPGCIDAGIADISVILGSRSFDVIECVSWANAGTNAFVLSNITDTQRLLYTPHSQPQWTLGDFERYPLVRPVFEQMIGRSDAVFLDSNAEKTLLPAGRFRTHTIPLGVDTERFKNQGRHRENVILCVCDCREHRKRVDLLIKVFAEALNVDPQLRLVLAGKGSDTTVIPSEIEDSVARLGYVSDETLLEVYNQSKTFVLLSDFEAFGLPIAEALCSGCLVLLNRQEVMLDLFQNQPGVYWTNNVDIEESRKMLLEVVASSDNAQAISDTAVARFGFEATYGRKRDVVSALLA